MIKKPLMEAVENDSLQANYDNMWAEYEKAVQKATGAIQEALGKQIAKSIDSGELDLVEMWEGKQKQFAEKGLLDWDTGPKASLEWKKANPKVPYPREFNEVVRNAASSFASAKTKLEEGYADLVKAYTKAKNVPRAKALRDEGAAVSTGKLAGNSHRTAAPSAEATQAQPKAIGSEGVQSATPSNSVSLAERLKGTKWINSQNTTFEWTSDGRLLHNTSERPWSVVDGNRVQITFGPTHLDVLEFDDFMKTFTQRVNGGSKTFSGQRTDVSAQTTLAASSKLQPLADRLKGTKWTRWKQPKNVFSWDQNGQLFHNDSRREWRVVDERTIEVRATDEFGMRIETWVFAEDMQSAVQDAKQANGGGWKSEWFPVK